MGRYIEYMKLTITTERKLFRVDLPKDADNNFEHEIDSIIKPNDLLDEHAIKSKVRQLLSK